VTPAPIVASWTVNTLEQGRIQARLVNMGVKILALSALKARDSETLTCSCVYSGRETTIACASLVPVTSRIPVDDLWSELSARRAEWPDRGITLIQRIGDCLAPGVIAAATYAGHQFARTLDQQPAAGFDAFR
jgi:dimethylamine/trimethylamine dehydrogenase